MWRLFRMMSTGREGLVARVKGASTRNVKTTVHESATRFCLNVNLVRKMKPTMTANTSICGRVRQPSARKNQAQVGALRSAKKTAASTNDALMTCVWPQTDMLNHTAGLNRKRPAEMRLHL